MKPVDKNITLDTSITVKWFDLKETNAEMAIRILRLLQNKEINIHQPQLAKYELGNVLIKGKNFELSKTLKALNFYHSLSINFIPENIESSQNTAQTAYKLNITYYDASFITVAKKYSATLITENPKHQKQIYGVKIKTLKQFFNEAKK